MARLSPVFDINGHPYVLLTPQLAGIETSDMGRAVSDLSGQRTDIINALDFLFTGI